MLTVVDEFVTEGMFQTAEMYQERCKQALKNDHKIQRNRFMIYECENCKMAYLMQLEEGLEEWTENSKPVPFTIRCIACSGLANDIMFHQGPPYGGITYCSYFESLAAQNKPIYRNFFWNDPNKDCGIPVLFEPDFYNCLDRPLSEFLVSAAFYIEQDVQSTMELASVCASDELVQNRKARRHPNGHDSWKRPRKNKKPYEY